MVIVIPVEKGSDKSETIANIIRVIHKQKIIKDYGLQKGASATYYITISSIKLPHVDQTAESDL